jgi:hypothetical protein
MAIFRLRGSGVVAATRRVFDVVVESIWFCYRALGELKGVGGAIGDSIARRISVDVPPDLDSCEACRRPSCTVSHASTCPERMY